MAWKALQRQIAYQSALVSQRCLCTFISKLIINVLGVIKSIVGSQTYFARGIMIVLLWQVWPILIFVMVQNLKSLIITGRLWMQVFQTISPHHIQ